MAITTVVKSDEVAFDYDPFTDDYWIVWTNDTGGKRGITLCTLRRLMTASDRAGMLLEDVINTVEKLGDAGEE